MYNLYYVGVSDMVCQMSEDKKLFSRGFRKQQLKAMEKNTSERESNKERILKVILDHEPAGLTTSDLDVLTGLHRDTIHERCKDLISEGLIIKTNKAGKYHLAEKAYRNPKLRGWFFKRKSMSNIMDWELLPDKENSFCELDKDNPEKYDHDDLSLFVFANRIGAFITYAMIHAVRPNEWVPYIKHRKRTNFRGRNRDKLAIEWIRNVIDPTNIFELFSNSSPVKRGRAIYTPQKILSFDAMKGHFSETLKTEEQKRKAYESYIRQRENVYRKFRPKNKKWSLYEMDDSNFNKLTLSFSKVFPGMYENLEQIRNGLDLDIQNELDWRKEALT
jgi:hypothetical protein